MFRTSAQPKSAVRGATGVTVTAEGIEVRTKEATLDREIARFAAERPGTRPQAATAPGQRASEAPRGQPKRSALRARF